MAQTKEEIISKIMKLMELGNSEKNDNPAEREAASRKAAQMMADYCINFAELRNSKPKEDTFATYDVDGSEVYKVDYESHLAGCIARSFDCKIINSRLSGTWKIIFVGSKHDLEISVYFFKHIRRTMYAMATKNVTQENILPSESSMRIRLKEARRNYCFGLVVTIGERLEDLYKRREEFIPSDCKALVVVKKDGLEKFFHKQFPNMIKGRRIELRGDMESFHKGKEDGKRVNLSRPITNNNAGTSAQIG
jgi:hypothetical protein